MAALHLAAEGRDYLMWCSDADFDTAVSTLDMRGLVELVQTLQDAMSVEQQTFESLAAQLEQTQDPLLQQRLSAALCTSQTRLARLCARNMRCFTHQALKARPKENSEIKSSSCLNSRVSKSPHVTSASHTDLSIFSPETDEVNTASFKNSLAFFQKATHLVTNTKGGTGRAKHTKRHRKHSRKESEKLTILDGCDGPENEEDNETFEQVLFVNGKPQYQEDPHKRSHSYDALVEPRTSTTTIRIQDHKSRNKDSGSPNVRSKSWTRVKIGGDGESDVILESTESRCRSQLVAPENSLREAVHSVSLTDISSVSVPKRKPIINFGSLSGANRSLAGDLDTISDRVIDSHGRVQYSDPLTLKRAHSFKEGLDYSNDIPRENNLVRTKSLYDVLGAANAAENPKPKLSRAPSVEEILESVKSLRAKRNMGKSDVETKSHKTSKSKVRSGLVGVRKSNQKEYSDYEHVHANYYENVNDIQYENVSKVKAEEVIYDSPKSLKKCDVGKPYDPPLYENLQDSEPTYMNVNQSNVYSNVEHPITDGPTYDVPRSSNQIYDIPPTQVRRVKDENTYDTPRNNRSVAPPIPSPGLIQAKNEQIKKIEDIFADCDRDSLDGDRGEPDIPSPDYGSDDEEHLDHKRKTNSSDYLDEGLGESDTRSYYTDEQGLEVILEEPEEDYISTHSSEEDLRRRIGLHLGLKAERRSLDGSEGIGSAEGDLHSGSEQGEEDSASSGIHSEDTPSPGPPIEIKDELLQVSSDTLQKKDDRAQKDRCIEVYPETLRQRQRAMAPSPSKVDIKNWDGANAVGEEDGKGKKFLPSVKALRNQFENGTREGSPSPPGSYSLGRSSNSSSTSSLAMSSIETSSGFNSMASSQTASETPKEKSPEVPVEPIYRQFSKIESTNSTNSLSSSEWNPESLLKRLYKLPEAPKANAKSRAYENIEGYLEKLPSGRKKSTYWNAWKRRYFCATDGILYCYQNHQKEKVGVKLPLMGGRIEVMDPNVVSVEDGKGHYIVVRCTSRQEAERWKSALDTQVVEDCGGNYVQPIAFPTNPSMLRDTIVIDIGSASVRAGVLASQATLPQLFFPSVVATNRQTQRQIWGTEALCSDVRAASTISFPVRPSHRISKYSVDLNAVSSLLQKTFQDLKVDPKNYNVQLSVPRVLNPNTQAELLKTLFDKHGVKGVNLTHQSILALFAYNATSGIVVDVGERIDVVPVTDGYIVDGGVSRVPYGGSRIYEHLKHFLSQRNVSLVNETDTYVARAILESICYCAQNYNSEKTRCTNDPESFEKEADLDKYFPLTPEYEALKNVSLDFGRFQATEGLFNPDAWGLDHPGLHKLVHKAIQECSMDIRKEMSRSIFLAGGVSQLPGLPDRLATELDKLTPAAIRPKVHSSPYRYHAAYLGACVLAESPTFTQSRISREEWQKQGNSVLRKWSL